MRVFNAALSLTAITTLFACSLWAQGASSLRGTVTDPTKAVVPTAKVTLTEKETGVARSAVTAASGEYQFQQVRPGTYSLTVDASGFASRTADNIRLLVDTPATLDIALDVASSSSSVSVVS